MKVCAKEKIYEGFYLKSSILKSIKVKFGIENDFKMEKKWGKTKFTREIFAKAKKKPFWTLKCNYWKLNQKKGDANWNISLEDENIYKRQRYGKFL